MTVKYRTNYDLLPSDGDYHVWYCVPSMTETSISVPKYLFQGPENTTFRVINKSVDNVQQSDRKRGGGAFLFISFPSLSSNPLLSSLTVSLPPLTYMELVMCQTLGQDLRL